MPLTALSVFSPFQNWHKVGQWLGWFDEIESIVLQRFRRDIIVRGLKRLADDGAKYLLLVPGRVEPGRMFQDDKRRVTDHDIGCYNAHK
ncbi:hypothetical protein HBH76_019980 [Parastagonospora nodorum]|nr:hypothetical protein HBH76_019980 [Parastagonospora nodorum]